MQRKVILVLGMHRSGTSALARMTNLLGCDIPHTLMPASPANSTGYWESNAIMSLNDDILHSAGSSWDDWLEFNPRWYDSPVAESFLERGVEILQGEYGTSPLFVLKDPRNCRLTRFWFNVLKRGKIEPLVVIPLRNPLEVVASLEARDGMHRDLAMLLWLRHVLDAEQGSRGHRRVCITYEELLDNWAALADRMQSALGIFWPRFSTLTGIEIDAFLDHNHHHIRSTRNLVADPMISEWVRETDRILGKWTISGEDADDYGALDMIRQQLNMAGPMFGRLTRDMAGERQHNSELRALLETREGELRQLNEQVSALQAAQEQEAQDEAARRAAQEEHIQQLADQLAQQQQAYEGVQQALEQAKKDLADLQHELANANSTLRQREEEIFQTLADLGAERQRAADIEAEFESAEERLKIVEGKLKVNDEWVFRLSGERKVLEDRAILAETRLSATEKALRSTSARLTEVQGRPVMDSAQHSKLLRQIEELGALNDSLRVQEEEMAQRWSNAQDELVTLSRILQQREAELAATQSSSVQPQSAERYNESQILSSLLQEREAEADRSSRQVEWLQKVNAVVTNYPSWWSFMPRQWREEKQRQRLLRRGLFDAKSYLKRYPDVSTSGMDPLRHYILHGIGENRTF